MQQDRANTWRSGAYLAVVERWWHKARTILRKLERLEWVTTPLIGMMVLVLEGSEVVTNYWSHKGIFLFEMGNIREGRLNFFTKDRAKV